MTDKAEAATVQVMNDIANTPQAVGPYSQLAIAGDTFFLSGQLPLDPKTGTLVDGGMAQQTEQVFNNIEAVLKGSGLGLSNVARCSVYLTDMNEFAQMNAIYEKRFAGHKPARETIGVQALAVGATIEITVIAYRGKAQ